MKTTGRNGAQSALAHPAGWHALDRAEVEARLSTGERGLTEAEAEARLARVGPNALPEEPPPSSVVLFLHQFRSPLIFILLVAAAVTVGLGEYMDAGVIAAVLVVNAIIGFVQERGAEVSVRALGHLVAPRARVVRDGRTREVESRALVPGDLVLLESGAHVPADLRLVTVTGLLVDESLLTGESAAVVKQAAPLPPTLTRADRTNMAYAGTMVRSGRGRGYAVATGAATELGAIAGAVRRERRPETPLQGRMTRFARLIGAVVAVCAALAFAVGVARGERPAEMFMVAVALTVSAVPEGLPVAFTVTLALGVRRMARRNAIIRRLPAVETLGGTTVICTDKTGTLTENRMTVVEAWAGGQTFHIGDGSAMPAEGSPLARTLLAGVLTNEATLTRSGDDFVGRGDPTETALLAAAARLGIDPDAARRAHALRADLPFEPERGYSAAVRTTPEGERVVWVKGAPERVLAMCTRMQTEDGPVPLDVAAVHAAARAMAARGLRVLAMARGPAGHEAIAEEPYDLEFLGLQGMMDPPRPGVREAVAGCRAAGIRVVMITGDHAHTARAIGTMLGIAGDDALVLTGAELAELDDGALGRAVGGVALYARVTPDQKLRVVRALRDRGEVVAVTGDGVNDAPALRAADIGVAMGRGGTDVAREAADMVLADDNFVSIYAAVEEGRVTFDNIRKVTFFLLSAGVSELLTILAALTLGWPLPFLPAQILWLNLVTDSLQVMALAFEPGEAGALTRPPRSRREGIISRALWERTGVAGLVMAAGTLLLFRWELDRSGSLVQAHTVALSAMVLFQTFHAGNARSESASLLRMSPVSNPFLFVAAAAALAVHVLALYLPPARTVLRIESLDLLTWLVMTLVALSIVVVMELDKALARARARPAHPRGQRPTAAA
jgi:calcium-translocating P-type ATPase